MDIATCHKTVGWDVIKYLKQCCFFYDIVLDLLITYLFFPDFAPIATIVTKIYTLNKHIGPCANNSIQIICAEYRNH